MTMGDPWEEGLERANLKKKLKENLKNQEKNFDWNFWKWF